MMARVCVRKDLGESLRAAVGEDAEDAQGRREREAEEVGKFLMEVARGWRCDEHDALRAVEKFLRDLGKAAR